MNAEMMSEMPPEAMQGMDADMMSAMPPHAVEGMDAPMMENMPPEAMQGMDAPTMANMPPECTEVMTSAQTEAMPADAQPVAGADDGGMGAMDGAFADPIQDAPGPMDATAEATQTAMDAGQDQGGALTDGLDTSDAGAAAAAATDEVSEDAPVVDEVDPNAGMV